MGQRPAKCYRDVERAYTRQATRKQRKNYVGGAPGIKVRKFTIGDQTKDFELVLDFKILEPIQIRDIAIENIRAKLSKALTEALGKEGYFVKLRTYPHHILRENKIAQGAGADRVSSGMKHSFGKNIGRAAQIKKNAIFLSLCLNEDKLEEGKKILQKIKYRINVPFKIEIYKHEDQRLSGRKKWTREMRKKLLDDEKAAADAKRLGRGEKLPAKADDETKENNIKDDKAKDEKAKDDKGKKGKK
jgi:large subunit ribosomal protein L10e